MKRRAVEKPDLKTVLQAVNLARKALGMEPLKEMPLGVPTLNGHSSLARALGGAVGTSERCPCCGHIIARVYYGTTILDGNDTARVREARRKVLTLHCLWPRARGVGREGWIEVPQLLARFDIAFHKEQYPELADARYAHMVERRVVPFGRKARQARKVA